MREVLFNVTALSEARLVGEHIQSSVFRLLVIMSSTVVIVLGLYVKLEKSRLKLNLYQPVAFISFSHF